MATEQRNRNAYEVVLHGGLTVVFVELTPSEIMLACRAAGNDAAQVVAGSRATREALRLSLRRVGEVNVTFADLDGDVLKRHVPRTRQVSQLSEVWGRMHYPTDDETEAMRRAMACEATTDGERWTVTLPGGRTVVMDELPPERVDDILRAGELAAKSVSAQNTARTIEAGRRAIRAIDGVAVTPEELAGPRWDERFSMRETILIGGAFNEIHGSGDAAEDGATGEPRPVSWTT